MMEIGKMAKKKEKEYIIFLKKKNLMEILKMINLMVKEYIIMMKILHMKEIGIMGI